MGVCGPGLHPPGLNSDVSGSSGTWSHFLKIEDDIHDFTNW